MRACWVAGLLAQGTIGNLETREVDPQERGQEGHWAQGDNIADSLT